MQRTEYLPVNKSEKHFTCFIFFVIWRSVLQKKVHVNYINSGEGIHHVELGRNIISEKLLRLFMRCSFHEIK